MTSPGELIRIIHDEYAPDRWVCRVSNDYASFNDKFERGCKIGPDTSHVVFVVSSIKDAFTMRDMFYVLSPNSLYWIRDHTSLFKTSE